MIKVISRQLEWNNANESIEGGKRSKYCRKKDGENKTEFLIYNSFERVQTTGNLLNFTWAVGVFVLSGNDWFRRLSERIAIIGIEFRFSR